VAVQYVGGTRTRSQPLKVVKGGKTSEFNQARRFALPSMLTRNVATGQESQLSYAECAWELGGLPLRSSAISISGSSRAILLRGSRMWSSSSSSRACPGKSR
jgi:hypothetical protein